MMLTQGINEVASEVRTDMTNGEAGTNISLFQKTQASLLAPIAGTDVALADKTRSGSSINVTYLLNTSLGNNEDLAEFSVNNGTITYNRVVKSPLRKTSGDEYNMVHNFAFSIVVQ